MFIGSFILFSTVSNGIMKLHEQIFHSVKPTQNHSYFSSPLCYYDAVTN